MEQIKVFIGSSRAVTNLGAEVRRGLDEIIERQLPMLLGDVNGVDKAIQQHFKDRRYSQPVRVFCQGLM